MLALTLDAFGLDDDPVEANQPDEVVGVVIPLAMATLGVSFVACSLLITGLPPLSTFLAKLGMLGAALHFGGGEVSTFAWIMLAVVLGSGLAAMISLSSSGIRTFWTVDRDIQRLRLLEAAPMLGLLLLCVVMTVAAAPVNRYLDKAAHALHTPHHYIDAVMSAKVPGDLQP